MDIGLELGWDPVGSRADDRRFEAYRELKRNRVRGPLFEELAPPPELLQNWPSSSRCICRNFVRSTEQRMVGRRIY